MRAAASYHAVIRRRTSVWTPADSWVGCAPRTVNPSEPQCWGVEPQSGQLPAAFLLLAAVLATCTSGRCWPAMHARMLQQAGADPPAPACPPPAAGYGPAQQRAGGRLQQPAPAAGAGAGAPQGHPGLPALPHRCGLLLLLLLLLLVCIHLLQRRPSCAAWDAWLGARITCSMAQPSDLLQ
jgi:hypothetical protein